MNLRGLSQDDTICAIATPAGVGSIGVIRVSGSQSLSIVSQIFRENLKEFKSHTVHHGEIVDPITHQPIDEALVLVMKGPRSYTGEDVVEIQSHGNPALLQRIVSALIACGARLASPGEFTRRAFLAGKMDLVQAEAVMEVIAAQSHSAQAMALNQLRGKLSGKIETLREEILSLLSQIEASIDFTEQGINLCSQEEISARISKQHQSLCNLLSRYEEGKQIREGTPIVIIGRPNVGKSSIMNRLLEEDRAIVTPIPGTTRDTLEEGLNLQGHLVKIIDTAGFRDTTDSIEQEGVRRGEAALNKSDIALFILDASKPIDQEDMDLINTIAGKKKVIVLNKIDLPVGIDMKAIHTKFPTDPIVSLSAITGEGFSDLENKIIALIVNPCNAGRSGFARLSAGRGGIESEANRPPHQIEPPLVALLRHKNALERAEQGMRRALQLVKENAHLEFLAADLREALDALGEIVGEVTTDDILDQIFNQFCIGK